MSERAGEERPSRSGIVAFGDQHIDDLAVLVDRPVQVGPAPGGPDVSLVDEELHCRDRAVEASAPASRRSATNAATVGRSRSGGAMVLLGPGENRRFGVSGHYRPRISGLSAGDRHRAQSR
jgi:hypothetical protein